MNNNALLIVDDDDGVRLWAAAIARRAGWTVREAADGAAGIAIAEADPPQLVLMDIQMPGLDGVDATAALRALDGPAASAVVVAFSSLRMATPRAHFAERGFDDCLAKPSSPELLTAMLDRWIPADETPPSERLMMVMSAGEIASMLVRFREQLAAALSVALDRPVLMADAHRLAGLAGTLGFATIYAPWIALSEGDDSARDAACVAARKGLNRIDHDLLILRRH